MRMGGAPPGAGPQEEVSELGLRAPSAPAPGCPGVQRLRDDSPDCPPSRSSEAWSSWVSQGHRGASFSRRWPTVS